MSNVAFTGVYTGSNYKPYYFIAEEFGSSKAFALWGSKLLRYIDSRATFTADCLRHIFGPTTINSWKWGGNRAYSGIRLQGEPHYREGSDHSYGRSLDMVFSRHSAYEVRKFIEENPELFPFITMVEEGESVNWLHISVGHMSDTFPLKNPNSIIFWSLDTGGYREVPRTDVATPFLFPLRSGLDG